MTYSPADIEEKKQLYLELLAKGKSERAIDLVKGMPTWGIRYQWRQNPCFLTQCRAAKAHGAEYTLLTAEMKLEETITRAEDEACPPQLPPLVKELMSHARWKAKCFNKDYADKQIHAGDDESPIKHEMSLKVAFVGTSEADGGN